MQNCSLPFEYMAWEYQSTPKELIGDRHISQNEISTINKARHITKIIRESGGSPQPATYIPSQEIMEYICSGGEPYQTSKELMYSYTPQDGSYRISPDAAKNISFYDKKFAMVRIYLNRPLMTQLIKSIKYIMNYQVILGDIQAAEIEQLESLDYDIEYKSITRNKSSVPKTV